MKTPSDVLQGIFVIAAIGVPSNDHGIAAAANTPTSLGGGIIILLSAATSASAGFNEAGSAKDNAGENGEPVASSPIVPKDSSAGAQHDWVGSKKDNVGEVGDRGATSGRSVSSMGEVGLYGSESSSGPIPCKSVTDGAAGSLPSCPPLFSTMGAVELYNS